MRLAIRPRFVILALLTAGACNADQSSGPGSRADLDQVVNELEVIKSNFAMGWSRQIYYPVSIIVPPNCTYVSAAQRFDCPLTMVGFTAVSQSYVLLDKSGAPQSAFDLSRTAAVRTTSTFTGTVQVNGSPLAVDGRESFTLSGLLSGKHTVDGTANLHYDGLLVTANVLGGGTSATLINTTITTAVSGLVLSSTSTELGPSAIPMGGTIAINNSTSVSGQPASLSSAVFSFDGSYTVVAVITRDGVTRSCPISMLGANYSICL